MATYERHKNVAENLTYRKAIPAGGSGWLDIPIKAHGFVDFIRIRFAAGEAGTLHIRPVVILPQDILIDLITYAENGDHYISGDNETIEINIKREVENHSIARVFYENTGEAGSTDSQLNVDIGVTYFEIIEPANIIG